MRWRTISEIDVSPLDAVKASGGRAHDSAGRIHNSASACQKYGLGGFNVAYIMERSDRALVVYDGLVNNIPQGSTIFDSDSRGRLTFMETIRTRRFSRLVRLWIAFHRRSIGRGADWGT